MEQYDCIVLEGYRGKETQNEYFETGRSKLKYPQSKHNQSPSLAVDVAPYPIDWEDKQRWYHFCGYVMGVADQMGIKLRGGHDWDGDRSFTDQSFHDLPHFELVE